MLHSTKNSQLLARVNFPLYTIAVLSDRHVLFAGGGGGAKTGILNVIEIYELINVGATCRAERVCHYETGNEAIMNCAVFNAGKYFLLFSGMEGNCQVYKIRYEVSDTDSTVKENGIKDASTLRKRNMASSDNGTYLENYNHESVTAAQKLVFKIQPIESFQTDFSDEPFQKLVKFSPKAKLLVTGGSDGHIRMWKHPKLNQVFDIEAHTDDVDDLDICPNGKLVVTVSRDGHGKLWNSEDGKLITELEYSLPSKSQSDKYIFRSSRFGIVEDTDDVALFCTLNPAVRRKPPLKSYLCKWNTRQFSSEKIVSTGNDMLSTMAISDNGHFLALGTQNGSIKIYIAFSLQCIHNFDKKHGIFVTSIHFLPSSKESLRITGGHEASLVSVSVDNHIIIHHIPHRASILLIFEISPPLQTNLPAKVFYSNQGQTYRNAALSSQPYVKIEQLSVGYLSKQKQTSP